MSIFLKSFEQEHKAGQQDQKGKVEGRKGFEIIACLIGIMLIVFPEGNQTCQGGDQGADPADVYAYQEVGIVGGELGEQNCRRNIADHLAGKNAEKQGAFIH